MLWPRLAFLSCLCFAMTFGASAAEPEVTLKKITLNELEKKISAEKGKVVLLDVWADFCIPCKKKFPMVVKLHDNFAAKGLVVMSLTIDDEPEGIKNAHEFLKKNKAHFANYIRADEEKNIEAYKKSLETNTIPIMHLYGRDGKKICVFESDEKYEALEAAVKAALEKK